MCTTWALLFTVFIVIKKLVKKYKLNVFIILEALCQFVFATMTTVIILN